MTAQFFPEGASVRQGFCDGVYCFRLTTKVDVVPAGIGPSWHQAVEMDLCASCLANFIVGGVLIESAHIFALALDGFYRECKGDVLVEDGA